MKREYRDLVSYTLRWVDDWYFDGKAPDIPEEKVNQTLLNLLFG